MIAPLEIRGHRGEPVPNTVWRREGTHLALLFPGTTYTAQMPLLTFATQVLRARGADELAVEYVSRPDAQPVDLGRGDALAVRRRRSLDALRQATLAIHAFAV